MFCTNCSNPVSGGNFCATCGAPLRVAPSDPAQWADEVRYEVVEAIPEVRDRIAKNFAGAVQAANMDNLIYHIDLSTHRNGEAWTPVILKGLAKRGFKVSKERTELRQRPVGWVLADALYVLAGFGYGGWTVQQGADGCTVNSKIAPGPLFQIGGTLAVTVERAGTNTSVRAFVELPGLVRDWGSKRVLDPFFENLA